MVLKLTTDWISTNIAIDFQVLLVLMFVNTVSKECGTLLRHWPVSEQTKLPFLSFSWAGIFGWSTFAASLMSLRRMCDVVSAASAEDTANFIHFRGRLWLATTPSPLHIHNFFVLSYTAPKATRDPTGKSAAYSASKETYRLNTYTGDTHIARALTNYIGVFVWDW